MTVEQEAESKSLEKGDDVKKVDIKEQQNEDEDLSEEDKKLKEEIDLLISRLMESNVSLYKPALETLRTMLRSATASMTSIPKPLKFLRPKFECLKEIRDKFSGDVKFIFYDIISVVAMTSSSDRECLRFRLNAPTDKLGEWGHEYVRHLAGEITQEWNDSKYDITHEGMVPHIKTIVTFFMNHNAEPDACDILMETDQLAQIHEFLDEHSYSKVCLYLSSCVPYAADPEDSLLLRTIVDIYTKFGKITEAFRYAVRLQECNTVRKVFYNTENDLHVKQMLFQAAHAHAQKFFNIDENVGDTYTYFGKAEGEKKDIEARQDEKDAFTKTTLYYKKVPKSSLKSKDRYEAHDEFGWSDTEEMDGNEKMVNRPLIDVESEDEDRHMWEILRNAHLTKSHLALARELDIVEGKSPDDVYKTNVESRSGSLDSARLCLVNSLVNGLVNLGFGKDAYFKDSEEASKWLYKHKEQGMMTATASLGLIHLWDPDNGLTEIDKYLYSSEDHIRAGALLACGIVSSHVWDECDAAFSLLQKYVTDKEAGSSSAAKPKLQLGAVIGLGIAYAGTNRGDVASKILMVLNDESASLDLRSFASVALGLIYVGSCQVHLSEDIITALAGLKPEDLKTSSVFRFFPLGLALLYLNRQEQCETVREALNVLEEPLKGVAKLMLEGCAYANTGNVLKIQQMLQLCKMHAEPEKKDEKEDSDKKKADAKKEDKKDDKEKKVAEEGEKTSEEAEIERISLQYQQSFAVLNIALIGSSEEIGTEMSMRMMGHIMRYGDPALRRAVPLALGLLSVSNPQLPVMDTLSKYSHDTDISVAINSIFALGLIGSGTNNARLSAILRQLATFHAKDANALFAVRLSQGLTHMGKGTLTLNPVFNDKLLCSLIGLAGLIITCTGMINARETIMTKHHYLLYFLVPSLRQRQLVTLDEHLEPLSVPVRVGQAVDVVGQAGKPKTITGFQTHTTPVLLSAGERAELATEEYEPMSSVLEGHVVLRKKDVEEMVL